MNTIRLTKKTTRSHALSAAVSLILVMTMLICLGTSVCAAASYPKPENNIADSAGILSEGTIRAIRNANESTAAKVGAVIAVCTVSTTGETSIGEYARAVFKDWQLGESILILVAVDDKNFYILPTTLIDSVLTSEELRDISNKYLEEDFAAGNTDAGVMKIASKLSSVLTEKLPDATKKAETPAEDTEKKGTTVGSVIVGFFKAILFIVLFAVGAFALLFVVAMFNDNVAALLRRYVFRRRETHNVPSVHYDERLYGAPQQRRQGRAPTGDRYMQDGGYNGYNSTARQQGYRQNPQQRRRPDEYTGYYNFSDQDRDAYYDSTGTRRR